MTRARLPARSANFALAVVLGLGFGVVRAHAACGDGAASADAPSCSSAATFDEGDDGDEQSFFQSGLVVLAEGSGRLPPLGAGGVGGIGGEEESEEGALLQVAQRAEAIAVGAPNSGVRLRTSSARRTPGARAAGGDNRDAAPSVSHVVENPGVATSPAAATRLALNVGRSVANAELPNLSSPAPVVGGPAAAPPALGQQNVALAVRAAAGAIAASGAAAPRALAAATASSPQPAAAETTVTSQPTASALNDIGAARSAANAAWARSPPIRAGLAVAFIALAGCFAVSAAMRRRERGVAEAGEISKEEDLEASVAEAPIEGGGLAGALLHGLLPAPKLLALPHVGVSFEVPWAKIQNCGAGNLAVDVPVRPAVWPLRAVFSRADGRHAWGKVALTVDIIDAVGLPPLLFCTPGKDAPPRRRAEETGGTGGAEGEDEEPWMDAPGGGCLPIADMEDAQDGAAVEGGAWLEVRSGCGPRRASIGHEADGRCVIYRDGLAPWELEWLPESDGDQVLVARRFDGRLVALATLAFAEPAPQAMDGDRPRVVRVDTVADASSPESALLLMCMLSALVFPPERTDAKVM